MNDESWRLRRLTKSKEWKTDLQQITDNAHTIYGSSKAHAAIHTEQLAESCRHDWVLDNN